jgi:flagellar P-ring protein precursor FlgI
VLTTTSVFSSRIKDLAMIDGVRSNQLIGYGLVVGLDGTGDKASQAPFTDQAFVNMLLQFGIRIPFGKVGQLNNIAAVAISASLPPFAKVGQKLDITVASLGNATSLRGGSLLMTPLKGADNTVYAMAQGNVVVSGFGAQGTDGSKVIVNTLSSGTIPNGATIENTVDVPFVKNGVMTFELSQADFTTAVKIQDAINKEMGRKMAQAVDASAVKVTLDPEEAYYRTPPDESNGPDEYKGFASPRVTQAHPENRAKYMSMIARLENIELDPAEVGARVIVNARTGTIVIGRNVTIAPVAVSHGNLSVIITERPYVSQPQPFAKGRTVTGKASDINVNQQKNRAFVFSPGPSLNDLVGAINSVGAAPGDLIAILEAIKAAGALNADLEVI